MTRALATLTTGLCCAALSLPALGQSYGPGQQGAVLKNPFGQNAAPAAPARQNNSYIEGMWANKQAPQPAGSSVSFSNPSLPQQPAARSGSADTGLSLPEIGPDMNADIAISEKEGPWMISIASYMGSEAPKMARTMAMELREHHRLQAYVFSRGREERKKEYERVKSLLEQQRDFYRQNNLPAPSNLRVRYRNVQEQCAVLVGGYATLEAARRDLERIRKLSPPDPKRVQLDRQFFETKDPKSGKKVTGQRYVNPFQQAFVVHNPTVKNNDGIDPTVDIALLRRLNRGAEYSLLDCKKPYTLVVKQFFTPTTMQPVNVKGASFLENLTMGSTDGERLDVAAENAHALADTFRKKVNLEAYVLHTKFSSIVTVGAFDSLDDPRLESIRNTLTSQLGVPQAVPMRVPQ